MAQEQYPENWDEIRRNVYKRDEYECQTCGAMGGRNGDHELHAHHKTPVSEGGSHDLSNLVTLCRSCHNNQHDHDITGEGPTKIKLPPGTKIIVPDKYVSGSQSKGRRKKGFFRNYIVDPLLISYGFLFLFALSTMVFVIGEGLPGGIISTGLGVLLWIAVLLFILIPFGMEVGFSYPKKTVLGYAYLWGITSMGMMTGSAGPDLGFDEGVLIGASVSILLMFLILLLSVPLLAVIADYLTDGALSEDFEPYIL